MDAGQQYCRRHSDGTGGYVHPLEEGCPLSGEEYFQALLADLVKYNLATQEEVDEAKHVLEGGSLEDYYWLRGDEVSHEDAMEVAPSGSYRSLRASGVSPAEAVMGIRELA